LAFSQVKEIVFFHIFPQFFIWKTVFMVYVTEIMQFLREEKIRFSGKFNDNDGAATP